MAKYKFRLETLHKVREATRGQRRAALADAFRAAELLGAKREELAAEEAQLRELQKLAMGERYLDVNRLLEAQRHELSLKMRGAELAKQTTLLAAETERRRQLLVESDRDVRVLELLDARHRREHDRQLTRLEGRLLDESALAQWRSR